LGINLLLGGTQYDSNEMWVGIFIIIFLVLSALSIALNRFTTKPDIDIASFSDTMTDAPVIIKDLINNFWYKNDPTSPTKKFDKKYVGIFSGIYTLILVILSTITGTMDSYPSVKAKEKNTKGYTAHLQSVVFSVGAIYGFIFLMWIIMAFKYST
jgi:hypothetical protein